MPRLEARQADYSRILPRGTAAGRFFEAGCASWPRLELEFRIREDCNGTSGGSDSAAAIGRRMNAPRCNERST